MKDVSIRDMWVERTVVAGRVVEKIVFKIPARRYVNKRNLSKAERRRRARTEHDKSLVNKVARLIHANFDSGDYLLTLTYSDAEHAKLKTMADEIVRQTGTDAAPDYQHAIYESARRDLDNWLRRVKNAAKKAGIAVKYIAVTSDMDAETGADCRVHHHVIINGDALAVAISKWRSNDVKATALWETQIDRTPLAKYLIAQVRHFTDEKAYKPSRNLTRPTPKDREVRAGHEPTPSRWGTVMYRAEYKLGGTQYLRYVEPPTKPERAATAVKRDKRTAPAKIRQ